MEILVSKDKVEILGGTLQKPDRKDIEQTISLSDLIMSRFRAHLEIERLDTKRLKETLNILGLDYDQFFHFVDIIPKEAFQGSRLISGR